MPDFDKELHFENTQAEYSQNLVKLLRKLSNGNFVAKAKALVNAFAMPVLA